MQQGPVRPIEFRIKRNVETSPPWDKDEEVDAELLREAEADIEFFKVFLEAEGYDVKLSSSTDEIGEWCEALEVDAVKYATPDAEVITDLHQRLLALAEERRETAVDWGYPKSKEIIFYYGDQRSNRWVSSERSEALFGRAIVSDPLHEKLSYLGDRKGVSYLPTNFVLNPRDFIRNAERRRIKDPQPTASGFAHWLYSLYATAYGDEEDRESGTQAEADIFDKRRSFLTSTDNWGLEKERFPWRLVHNGLRTRDLERDYLTPGCSEFFEIPDLKVNGLPLRASPDLVYLNSRDSKAIIVEVKHSHLPLPRNLWPNIWGQLWCYAQSDRVAGMKEVTVIGEIWADWTSRDIRTLNLRASVRRNPRASAYDKFFRRLFEIYSGL